MKTKPSSSLYFISEDKRCSQISTSYITFGYVKTLFYDITDDLFCLSTDKRKFEARHVHIACNSHLYRCNSGALRGFRHQVCKNKDALTPEIAVEKVTDSKAQKKPN